MQLDLPLAVAPVPVPVPMGTLRYIQLGSEIVGYRFRRARRRSIGIVIDDNGLRVAAPGHTPITEVEAFIREKARWVLKKLSEWRAAPKPPVVNWSDGSMIALLGETVRIDLLPGRRDISLQHGRLGIGLAPRGEPAVLRKRGIAWLKDRARALLGERLAHYAARLGVPTPALTLSNARTQWGVSGRAGMCASAGAIHPASHRLCGRARTGASARNEPLGALLGRGRSPLSRLPEGAQRTAPL